jgi:hypothetical protein
MVMGINMVTDTVISTAIVDMVTAVMAGTAAAVAAGERVHILLKYKTDLSICHLSNFSFGF